MSYHHTHCPACNKVLRVRYGMPEKCPCPGANEGGATAPEIDRVLAENARLRAENERLVQRGADEAIRVHGLNARIAELDVYRQIVKEMTPDMNRAQAYGQQDGTAFHVGNNHLRNAMDEIERLNRELAAARQPGAFETSLRASLENYLNSLKKG